MKTRRKLIAVAAAVLLCLPVGLTNDNTAVVHAQTVQEKINNASKEKQEALDKIKAIRLLTRQTQRLRQKKKKLQSMNKTLKSATTSLKRCCAPWTKPRQAPI